jgi:hypothetical protein
MVHLTIQVDHIPLKRCFVSHYDFFRNPQELFFQTDDQGRVAIIANGQISIRLYAQNDVVRVLDGANGIEVSQEFKFMDDGQTLNITLARSSHVKHFRILNQAINAYDLVWRQFKPFNSSGRGRFPFGSAGSIDDNRHRPPRIEIKFPDNLPTFVEPCSMSTTFPLIHLRESLDLFGSGGAQPRLIPHELSHALQFAIVAPQHRVYLETHYLAWIMSELAAGRDGTHSLRQTTSPMIAYIEALGIFGERFFLFARDNPTLTGISLRQAFFRNELADDGIRTVNGRRVASLRSDGSVLPVFRGKDVEAAVYGALFVDLARRIGLREVVGLVMESAQDGVFAIPEFRLWCRRFKSNQINGEMNTVAAVWGLL